VRASAVFRGLAVIVAVVLAAAALGIVSTLSMIPFWRWLEATHGIEAIGHSGPAEWC
jgi:hypothetical protein